MHELDGRAITQVVSGPAGLAVAGTRPGTVYALAADGDVVWKQDVGAPMRTAPAATPAGVVAVPRGDTAYALTPTGEVAWTLPIDNERPEAAVVRMASPVGIPGGDVAIATLAGNVHRVNANGTVEWTYAFGGDLAVEATPAVTNDGDVVAAAFPPGREGEGHLARIDGDTGSVDCPDCWRLEIGSQVVGAPTAVADAVLVPLRDGNAVQSRSLSDGSLRWETAFDDSVPASPSLHEDLALVGDIRGTVRALQLSGGQVEWEFNPLGDDPDPGDLATSECSALTVADSAAVDAAGVAWTPFWRADICSGFPPQDSRESPFYRLDAETGEILDRARYPKANHGPSLLGSGVWTGSDQGGVRVYPSRSLGIALHQETSPGEVLLIVNTDLEGAWSISIGDEFSREGQGQPPHVVRAEIPPGEYTLAVDVASAHTTGDLTVPEDDEAGDDAQPAGDPPGPDDENGEEAPPDADPPDDEGTRPAENGSQDAQSTPAGVLAVLVGILAATRGRRRA